jgi:hypothetical protein
MRKQQARFELWGSGTTFATDTANHYDNLFVAASLASQHRRFASTEWSRLQRKKP